MQLRLTVLDPANPARGTLELAVEAPVDTPFGRIRPHLESLSQASEFWADGRPLRDSALFGLEPLVRGVTITAGADRGSPIPCSSGVVELGVVGGCGAGHTFKLGRGEHVIGRAMSASVCLDDPDVSRAHAIVSVGPDAVLVRDLEPTNPSFVEDEPVPGAGAILTSAARLRVGSTTLALAQGPRDRGAHRVADGYVHVHRPPRFVPRPDPVRVRFPREPARPGLTRAPLLAALAPLVLSAGLALALSSPMMLLFALISPVLLLGQWWSDRRTGRVSHRRLLRGHRREIEQTRATVQAAVRAEARRRRAEQPDLVTVASVVRGRTAELWQRRPGDADHLTLRIGTARQGAGITLEDAPDEPVPEVDDLPVCVDLGQSGVVGVAGHRDSVLSMVGAMLAQLTAWHSPRHVRLCVVAASMHHAQDWNWTSYLPHAAADGGGTADVPALGEQAFTDQVARLKAQVAAHREGRADPMRVSDLAVLVIDGVGELRTTPHVADLLRDGPAAGILIVAVDRHRDALPSEAAAVVELDAGTRARLQTRERAL